MAVRIRMKMHGRKHRHYFRIVAIDHHQPRDGRVLEELGSYDPMVKNTEERVKLLLGVRREHLCQFAAEGADPLAEIVGAPGEVAAPKGHPRRLARRRLDEDAIFGNVGDAPDLRAKQEGIAGARLEDELFVKLADLCFAIGEHERVETAVGDRTTALRGE